MTTAITASSVDATATTAAASYASPGDHAAPAVADRVVSPIILRSPHLYKPQLPSSSAFQAPPLHWLARTWTVTHSTLPMWRKAKNVRISYKLIEPAQVGGPVLLDDEVRSEPLKKGFMPYAAGQVRGVDTPASAGPDGVDGGWNWRGKGWLRIASSHWEVLGWGEKGGESWVITWFAPSLFTPAGLDIYCDRAEGISEGLYGELEKALEALESKEMAQLCRADMKKIHLD